MSADARIDNAITLFVTHCTDDDCADEMCWAASYSHTDAVHALLSMSSKEKKCDVCGASLAWREFSWHNGAGRFFYVRNSDG